jgi:hypothetical protein
MNDTDIQAVANSWKKYALKENRECNRLRSEITRLIDESVPNLTPFVEGALEANPRWKVQSFAYYAAHFLVGSHGQPLENRVRALADVLKKQYDLGVEDGKNYTQELTALRPKETT